MSDVVSRPPTSGTRPRVVVVGSGFAGFYTVRRLCRANLDVTVLSTTDGFLFAPLLPDVAVGTVDPRSAVVPVAPTLRGARLVRGRATGVDLEAGTVAYLDPDDEPGQGEYDRRDPDDVSFGFPVSAALITHAEYPDS